MKEKNTKRLAQLGLLTALSLIASYIELLIPMPIGIPGVKLGLANLMIVWALYAMGPKEALAVNGVRIVLSGFLFGNLSMILYSLAGGCRQLCLHVSGQKIGRFPDSRGQHHRRGDAQCGAASGSYAGAGDW